MSHDVEICMKEGKWGKMMEEERKDVKSVQEDVQQEAPKEKKRIQVLPWILAIVFMLTTIAGGVLYMIKPTISEAEEEAYNFFAEKDLVTVKNGEKWGYIDNTGKYIINPQFDAAYDFKEGLARVLFDGQYGYIDAEGKYVINPQFDAAYDFVDGLALVRSGEKWGYIDTAGAYVINPQFDDAFAFHNGLAMVKSGEKWGYIDATGTYVINPQFDDAYNFENELAKVVSGDHIGFIDKDGKVVIGYQYIAATNMTDDGYARVVTNDKKYAIIDRNGNTIISGLDGVDGIDTKYCIEDGCDNTVYSDDYCYTHQEDDDDDYVYTYYCNAYGCLDKQVLGGYCLYHYYIYG